ncbi:hypothetical protein C2845_PM07G29930 [Panicum miliaceum]|uniref:Uncharacterized protein n=1 Tax=Panicum miliaceum TaxID=4540 RepID=A0A3L6STY8_PANMI|nr:hypothetical protein C2845_PM07G29930 [Panicum miliaceum]
MILNPYNPFVDFREDKLGKRPQWFREYYEEHKALADNIMEHQQILIKRYRTKGYAEDYREVEVTDEDCTEVTSEEDRTNDKDS